MIRRVFRIEILLDEENGLDNSAESIHFALQNDYCEKDEKVISVEEVIGK